MRCAVASIFINNTEYFLTTWSHKPHPSTRNKIKLGQIVPSPLETGTKQEEVTADLLQLTDRLLLTTLTQLPSTPLMRSLRPKHAELSEFKWQGVKVLVRFENQISGTSSSTGGQAWLIAGRSSQLLAACSGPAFPINSLHRGSHLSAQSLQESHQSKQFFPNMQGW